jgi:hypothetical protein
MRRGTALAAAVALGTAGAACTTLIGLGDIDRVDCVEDCGASGDGTMPETSPLDGSGDATADQAADAGPDREPADGADGADGAVDARDAADAPEEAYVDKGIRCGDAGIFCKPTLQVCCVNGAPKCDAPAQCNALTSIQCDDTADCVTEGLPGDVCCGTSNLAGQLVEAVCKTAVTCAGTKGHVLCDPMAAKPCPDAGACAALSGGYSACK